MTAPALALRRAVVAALLADPILSDALSGVFDGPPARVRYPYVELADGSSTDWSSKTSTGREHGLVINIWDDAEEGGVRLLELMGAVETAIGAMPQTLEGHRIASLTFLRSRLVRNPGGQWAGIVQFRVRTIQT